MACPGTATESAASPSTCSHIDIVRDHLGNTYGGEVPPSTRGHKHGECREKQHTLCFGPVLTYLRLTQHMEKLRPWIGAPRILDPIYVDQHQSLLLLQGTGVFICTEYSWLKSP